MNPRRLAAALAVLSTVLAGGCAAAVDPAPVTPAPITRPPAAPAPITRAPVAPAPMAPPLAASAPGSERTDFISVTGIGKVVVSPDTALLEVGAESRARSVGDATADVGARMRAILERVKPLGVEDRDIATVLYTVEPLTALRPSDHEPPLIVGYRATNIMQFRIRNLAAVGRILDAAVLAGANTVRGLAFTVGDPAVPQTMARELAVKSAVAKARELTHAAGVGLGDLLALSEDVVPLRPQVGLFAGTVAVEPGQIEIVATVIARYRVAK